jgi:RNA polymerase sigma-70 factor, ECF subfamily
MKDIAARDDDPSGPTKSEIPYEIIYRALRRRARYFLSGEPRGHSWQPTEVVHEVWIRMQSGNGGIPYKQSEFLPVAGKVMRNLLVDYARKKKTVKNGGKWVRIDFNANLSITDDSVPAILELDELLENLAKIDERAAKVVELRFFGGITEEQITKVLNVSLRTVKRDWEFAKIWMRANMNGGEAQAGA